MSKRIIILDENEIYNMPKRRNLEDIYEMAKQAKQMGRDINYVFAYNNGWNDCLNAIGGGEDV